MGEAKGTSARGAGKGEDRHGVLAGRGGLRGMNWKGTQRKGRVKDARKSQRRQGTEKKEEDNVLQG